LKFELLVQQKDVVVPGDPVARGDVEPDSPYLYKEGDTVYACVTGILEVRDTKLIVTPLQARYIPKPDDLVIGLVEDVGPTYWVVDINSPYEAQLPVSELPVKQPPFEALRRLLEVGDYILAKVVAAGRNRMPLLSLKCKECGKVTSGKVIEVNLASLKRLVGKRGGVIEAICNEAGVKIFVGSNGRVWIKGESRFDEDLAAFTIKQIESGRLGVVTPQVVAEFIRKQRESVVAPR